MTEPRQFVEKPPHIDERRMRHISDEDLFAALELERPGLEAVGEAVARSNWPAAYRAWSDYFSWRERPVPVVNREGLGKFLRETADPAIDNILAAAVDLQTKPIDYADGAMGKSRLYGFHYMAWLTPLIEAYAITGDDGHVQTFARLFNGWYDTRDQVRGEWQMDVIWYSLGLGIRTPIFSLAYHACRRSPALDWQTQSRLLKTILGAARWLAEEHDAFRYGNWQHQGVAGLFELATFWPEFRGADSWAELGWTRLLEHLELDVYPDGGHHERVPSYHAGVLSGYRRVADAAELNWGRRLQDQPRFYLMYRWLLAQCTPPGTTTNFNDSGFVWIRQHMVQGALLFDDPEFKWLAEELGTPQENARTLASLPDRLDGRTAAQSYADMAVIATEKASVLLPSSKIAIMRGGWDAADLYMAINYGPYVEHELESHSHFDTLSFVCFGYGTPLAIEAGKSNTYDDPLYHDWYRAARAHNMVTVDGQNPLAEGKDADLLLWSTSPVADLFQAEHAGYDKVLHRRTILFVRNEYWVVHDELDREALHRIEWHLHSPTNVTIVDRQLRPVSGAGMMVLPATPQPFQAELVHGLMVVPGPRGEEGKDERREVQGIRYTQQDSARRSAFLNVLYPVSPGLEPRNVTVEMMILRGGAGESCAISAQEGRDLIVMGAGETTEHRQVEDWSSDGRVWVVRAHGSWAAYDASYVAKAGEFAFSASSRLESICVQPAGEGIAGEVVALRKTTVRLSIGQAAQRMTLNGVTLPWKTDGSLAVLEVPTSGQYCFTVA